MLFFKVFSNLCLCSQFHQRCSSFLFFMSPSCWWLIKSTAVVKLHLEWNMVSSKHPLFRLVLTLSCHIIHFTVVCLKCFSFHENPIFLTNKCNRFLTLWTKLRRFLLLSIQHYDLRRSRLLYESLGFDLWRIEGQSPSGIPTSPNVIMCPLVDYR